MARFSKRKEKAYRKQHYSSNKEKSLQSKQLNYKCNADVRKQADRDSYHARSASKRRIMRRYNALNVDKLKSIMQDAYTSNPASKRESVRQRYASNPSPKKKAEVYL